MAVRRERVIVEADDRYTGPLTRMGAATGAFRMAMADAEKQSKPFQRAVDRNAKETDKFTRSAAQAGSEIDRLSGRMRIWLDLAVLVGPAFLPMGAVAVPAVMGLANALGAAALGAGAMAAALPGVGDAVKALGEFRDDPSAANAEKLAEAFEKIGPDAQKFAVAINREALPALRRMRDQAAAGGLPWLTEAIGQLEDIEPRVSRILRTLADATGEEILDAATSFNSERWDEFFTFMEAEVPGTISDVAAATGNLTHGLAEMWMAFTPVNNDFGNWLVARTGDFDAWAARLDSTQGFADFVEFIEETGPKLEDFTGSFVDAFVQIADAAAPFSGPTLTVLTKLLDVTASIADSDLGTPLFGLAAGLAAVNRTMAITGALTRSQVAQGGIVGAIGATRRGERSLGALASGLMNVTSAQERAATSARQLNRRQIELREGIGTATRAGAGIGALAIASTGAADGLGLANTASLALMGTMVAPGWGTALGGAAGLVMDLAGANNDLADAIERANRASASGQVAASADLVRDARDELEKYTDGISQGRDLLLQTLSAPVSLGGLIATGNGDNFIKGLKNQAEGLFGDSDIEEESKKYEDAARRAGALSSAVRGLAAQMRTPITGNAEQQIAKLDQVVGDVQPAMAKLGITTEEYAAAARLAGGVNPVVANSPILLARAKEDLARMNSELAQTARDMDSVHGRSTALGDAFAAMGTGAGTAAFRAQSLANALGALVNPALEASAANDAFHAALARFEDLEHIRRGFQGQTAAARENRDAMRDGIQTLQQRIATEAAVNPRGNFAQMLVNGREELIRNAVAAGASEDSVRRYINTLNLTPRSLITAIRSSGMPEAKKQAAELNVRYSQLRKPVRTIVRAMVKKSDKVDVEALEAKVGKLTKREKALIVRINNRASKPMKEINREANLVEQKKRQIVFTAKDQTKATRAAIDAWSPAPKTLYINEVTRKQKALGGYEPKPMATGGYQPMMLGSGPTLYMWREPETKGESFIPHADDHRRPRAKSILEQTASLFGGSVVWNALGGAYGQGRMQPITVNAGSTVSRLTGSASVELRTPWGSQEIEVQMREIARDEIDGDHQFRYDHRQG